MKIWTVANQKGGVGKTTSVATLGGLLASQGQRVLMVDSDPHSSLTSYFGYDSDALDITLYQIFERDPNTRAEIPDELFLDTKVKNLTLIPSSIALATLDRKLSQRPGMGLVMKKITELLADEYDYLLFDCPPVLGVVLVNALAACEQLIIPVQTEFLALKGLERMMHTLNMVIKAQRHSLRYVIVPTMFDRRTRASIMTLRSMRDQFGMHLWEKVIPVDTKFRDASKAHMPLNKLLPESHGVVAYEKLLKWLLNQALQTNVA